MEDIRGRTVCVGDTIVYTRYQSGSGLDLGKVIGFTASGNPRITKITEYPKNTISAVTSGEFLVVE